MLKYFESPDSHVAEEAIVIPAKLLTLKTAHQVNIIAEQLLVTTGNVTVLESS